MTRIIYLVDGSPEDQEHQFVWSPHRVLLHLLRVRGNWVCANWMDAGIEMEPVKVMWLMGQTARTMTRRERFLFWLYERGWRDEPI